MSQYRLNEPGSLYLKIQGKDHTPLTDLLKEHGIQNNGPVMTFSGGAQFFVEILDWTAQNPVQVGEICGVLIALINRFRGSSIKYTVDGKSVEVNNISSKSAVELAKDLNKGPVSRIIVDLTNSIEAPAEDGQPDDRPQT
ncbi:hypothetical protein JHD42_10825 [Aeromonas veronii]|uniref:hypothetical protein n=1 Tax=Aeromonas veronii TaxID=654 RepID=UPI0018F2401B|nr:hypothetical protein [Aeromonas veronii]MBJ7581599.1 hypothetical protein [Aeromonas veronii]